MSFTAWSPSPPRVGSFAAAFALLAWIAGTAGAAHHPAVTATIYVHGFDPSGADHEGIYGADRPEPLLDSLADLVGIPTINDPGGAQAPNVVAATTYYGSLPPSYYTAGDLAEIEAVTAQWGGGIPRYALIVAKYARFVMERSGAQQVNFVSASMGSFVTRWLIEKDSDGLASEGKIARWLTLEGVVSGNWAASQDELVGLWETFQTPTIDVEQMHYDWVEANLHSPRTEADSPLYADILVGQSGSTKDDANNGGLTALMLFYGEFQPNDGVQGLNDAVFQSMTAPSRFLGKLPTMSHVHVNHYGLESYQGAWVQVATFLTERRRVTITMTAARVDNIHETVLLRPAEIVFGSRVHSPEAAARWGITDPVSARHREGASSPIRNYASNGQEIVFSHVLYDDFILDGETALDVELWADEIDRDFRYGVTESFGGSGYEALGGGWISVPVSGPGTHAFQAAEWSCDLAVDVFDYPFGSLAAADEAASASPRDSALAIRPNPASGPVRILLPASDEGRSFFARGTREISIFDLRGREVQRISIPGDGSVLWDGTDTQGHPVPNGVYLCAAGAGRARLTGRLTLVR